MVSRFAARLLPFAFFLGACAEEAAAPLPPLPVYPPIEPMVLKIEGATACDIDADCDEDTFCFLSHCSVQCESGAECDSGVCDDRGRCTESTSKSAISDLPVGPPNNRLMGIEITEQPELEIQVSPGEEFVTVTFETSSSVNPLGGLSYRIESSADDSLARRVQTSNGGTTHTVVIPTGFANPDFEGDSVSVKIVTPIGTIPLILKGLTDIYNHYEGTLKLNGLGTEIPIKFGVLRRGDGTEWFIVPSGYADMFGPVAQPVPTAIGADQRREARVSFSAAADAGYYRGKFSTLYAIPTVAEDQASNPIPVFARKPVFAGLTPNTIKREIKYDFKKNANGTLKGNFSDTWTSFYATNATQEKIEIAGAFTMKVSADSRDWTANWNSDANWNNPEKIVEVVNNTTGDGSPTGYIATANAFEISSECITAAKGWKNESSSKCDGDLTFYNAGSATDNYTRAKECAAELGNSTGTKTITERVVDQLKGSATDTNTQSFTDFLADCADPNKKVCYTELGRACGLEFEAKTFQNATGGSAVQDKAASWKRYVDLLLDVTGGLQLAAFYTDTMLRRKWLDSASYASTAATGNAAARLNAELMDEYETRVFNPNVKALRYYMAPSVLAYLSSSPQGAEAEEQRDRLLISMVAAWTAAADSLTLSAQRWNEIYRLDADRKGAANKVAANLGELYRSAIVIMQLQRNAGRGAEGAPIATGLNTLLLRYELLTNSFNELLFARDGEVAVSTSLDPNNPGLLTQRREAALEAVDDASVKIDGLLEKLLENDIRNLEIYNGLDTSIDASQKRLLELCGKPVGGRTTDERPSTLAGVCGFWQDASVARTARAAGEISVTRDDGFIKLTVGTQGTSDVLNLAISSPEVANVVGSAAALAVYDIGIAQRNLNVATAAQTAAATNVTLIGQQVSSFSGTTASQIPLSDGTSTNPRIGFERRYTARKEEIKARFDLFVAQIAKMKGYEDEVKQTLAEAETSETRVRDIQIDQESVAIAAAIANALGVILGAMVDVTTSVLEETFKETANTLDIAGVKSSECVQMQVGTTFYTGAPSCAISLGAMSVSKTFEILGKVSFLTGKQARNLSLGLQEVSKATTAVATASSNIAIYRLQHTQRMAEIADAKNSANSQSEFLALQAWENREYSDNENLTQYHADLDHLAELLLEKSKLVGESNLAGENVLAQAAQLQRAKLAYYAIVADAQREEGTLDMLESQRTKISALIAGPQAFFFAANGLTEAERELDRAKRKMSDWLVAIEYAAVRPFYSERMAILLARNTYQLRALADRLSDLEAQCGGETNLQKVTISLKKQTASSDSAAFRNYIESAATADPDVNVRYSVTEFFTAQTTGDNLLIVPFSLSLGDFANLSATCNAKIESVALSVDGVDSAASPFGEGAPYGTIIYHGDAKTYSCQPGIDAYITQFGQGTGYVPGQPASTVDSPVTPAIPESGTFGSITKFVVDGRAASPVMAVNTLPSTGYTEPDIGAPAYTEPEMGSENSTLKGLPVAGSYTLIIDKAKTANTAINWEQLEDVKLQITYSYQDVFSSTSDCANSL